MGEVDGESVRVLGKRRFATPYTPGADLREFVEPLRELADAYGAFQAVGVSCGSPLDSAGRQPATVHHGVPARRHPQACRSVAGRSEVLSRSDVRDGHRTRQGRRGRRAAAPR